MDINLKLKIEKKHLIIFSVFILLLLSIFSLSDVDTNQAYHYIQQIAKGPLGSADALKSIDNNGDGVIDNCADADTLDGLHSTDLGSQWINIGLNDIYYSSGNVGIGTSSPSQKLDINGYVKANGLCIGNDCKTSWDSIGGSDREYAVFNINDKSTATYLYSPYSAFHAGSMCSVRTNQGKSSGKWYWEVNLNSVYHLIPGISTNDPNLLTANVGTIYSQNAWGLYTFVNPDQIRVRGVGQNINLNAIAGSTVMFALDLDSKKLWVGVDGVWANSGNPSSNSNPTVSGLPSGNLYPTSSGERSKLAYFNFGQQDFKYSVPSGFNPGWYE